jgi:hypothetical protein
MSNFKISGGGGDVFSKMFKIDFSSAAEEEIANQFLT